MFTLCEILGSCVHKFVLHRGNVYIFNYNLSLGDIAHSFKPMKSSSPNSIVHFAAPNKVNRDYNSDTLQVFRVTTCKAFQMELHCIYMHMYWQMAQYQIKIILQTKVIGMYENKRF